jgi:hypothetical protein
VNPPLDEQQARLNQNVIDFLRTELELGFTFVRTAEIEASVNNREHFERALQYSESAVETIRRFESKIADPHARIEILQGADDLEKRIVSIGFGSTPQK